MMDNLGVVILAGHNEGTANLYREYLEKKLYSFAYSFFSDSFIFGKNKTLLRIVNDTTGYKKLNIFKQILSSYKELSALYKELRMIRNGRLSEDNLTKIIMDNKPRVINKVVDANRGSECLNSEYNVCVGPKGPLEKVIGKSAHVVDQGNNITENIDRGLRFLYDELGYKNDYFLVCCGDLSAIKPETIDTFVSNFEKRFDPDTKIYAGIGTRENLAGLIKEYKLEKYGRLAPRFFPLVPGRVSKFGLTLKDDEGIVGETGRLYQCLWANLFIGHRLMRHYPEVAGFIYSNKRGLLKPSILSYVVREIGSRGFQRIFLKRDFTITDAEKLISSIVQKIFPYIPGMKCKGVFAPAEAVLDIDTWKDHYRNSALIQKRDDNLY